MTLRFFGIDPGATPETTNSKLGPDGFSGCDCLWSAMKSKLGLEVLQRTSNPGAVEAHLDTGGVAFAEVRLHGHEHYVLITSWSDGKGFNMLDPFLNVEGQLNKYYEPVSYRLIRPVAPSPPPPPVPPARFLRGLHDRAGGDWLEQEHLDGYCVIPVYHEGLKGVRLELSFGRVVALVNLRYSYAVDDGGRGTMPAKNDLSQFEEACLNTIRLNPHAEAFIYGNEMNNRREWPKGITALSPEYYVESYNRLWFDAPEGTQLIPGAIDPYNPGWGDWRKAWRYVLDNIADADGIALHAYSHGVEFEEDKVFGDDPLKGVYYNLRVIESLQEVIPPRFRDLPQYVTETNPLADGSREWPNAPLWVRSAYEYFKTRGVATACLFRFNHRDWSMGHLVEILDVLRQEP